MMFGFQLGFLRDIEGESMYEEEEIDYDDDENLVMFLKEANGTFHQSFTSLMLSFAFSMCIGLVILSITLLLSWCLRRSAGSKMTQISPGSFDALPQANVMSEMVSPSETPRRLLDPFSSSDSSAHELDPPSAGSTSFADSGSGIRRLLNRHISNVQRIFTTFPNAPVEGLHEHVKTDSETPVDRVRNYAFDARRLSDALQSLAQFQQKAIENGNTMQAKSDPGHDEVGGVLKSGCSVGDVFVAEETAISFADSFTSGTSSPLSVMRVPGRPREALYKVTSSVGLVHCDSEFSITPLRTDSIVRRRTESKLRARLNKAVFLLMRFAYSIVVMLISAITYPLFVSSLVQVFFSSEDSPGLSVAAMVSTGLTLISMLVVSPWRYMKARSAEKVLGADTVAAENGQGESLSLLALYFEPYVVQKVFYDSLLVVCTFADASIVVMGLYFLVDPVVQLCLCMFVATVRLLSALWVRPFKERSAFGLHLFNALTDLGVLAATFRIADLDRIDETMESTVLVISMVQAISVCVNLIVELIKLVVEFCEFVRSFIRATRNQ
jgi:hypothetical protein